MQNMISSLHYGRRDSVVTTYLKQCKGKPYCNAAMPILPA